MEQPILSLLLVALPVGLLSACGPGAAPEWVSLTAGLRVEAPDGVQRVPWRDRELELHTQDGQVSLRLPVRREDWSFEAARKVWLAPVGLDVPGSRLRGLPELLTPAGPLPRGNPVRSVGGEALEGFLFLQGNLVFGGVSGPPDEAVLRLSLLDHPSSLEDEVRARTFSGTGPMLLPGMRARSLVAVPEDSILRFCFAFEPLLHEVETRVRLRVLYAGREVHAETLTATKGRRLTWRSIEIEPQSRGELVFEVGGDPALAAVLDPLLGPREIGRPGARPWGATRPDLLVCLADTFRADNLGPYGGESGVTPALDAFAANSLVFTQARSTAPWTLPAHASLFSGFFPHQVGIAGEAGAVPEAVEMLAESLSKAGYRTGAVTDAGLVSARFGLGQGFHAFSEESRELAQILEEARAFLEADDGRPAFLFVQSYRAHWPYHSGAESRRLHGQRLGLEGEAGPWLAAAVEEARVQGKAHARRIPDLEGLEATPRFREIAAALRSQYLAGVADLDRQVGAFLAGLDRDGFFEHGCFLFTSDHGEAFGEHGALFHGRRVHEEQTRIPLLLRGPGISPGRVAHAVSLVDVAPTLVALARVPSDPRWPGRSLLAVDEERPSYAFECSAKPASSMMLVDEGWKWILDEGQASFAPGALREAYHLAEDPRERQDLAGSRVGELGRLEEEHARAFESSCTPLFAPLEAHVDAEKATELAHLGY